MAGKNSGIFEYPKVEEPPGFDVVCVIGRVTFSDEGVDPYQAAFTLIGQHKTPGTFTFPAENGGQVIVEVSHEEEIR